MPDLVSSSTFPASFPDERAGTEHAVNVARLLRGRCRLHKESVMSDLAPIPGLRPVRLDDKTKSIMDRAIARVQSLSRLLMTFIPNSTSILPTTILKQSFVDGAQYLLLFLSQGDHTSESKAALGIA